MYTREVTIEEYWPLIVKNTEEFGQIAVAENPEFNQLAKCIYDALKDAVITDATPNGVAHWERMLGLVVTDDMSLDDRKAAILTRLSIKLPYTMRVLKQLIAGIVGEGNVEMNLDNDTETLTIETYKQFEDSVCDLTSRVMPKNLDVDYRFIMVPPGYLECSFLEQTGTQYINTSTVMTSETGLKMTYCSPGKGRMWFGVQKNESGDNGRFFSIHCHTDTSGAQHHWLMYGWNGSRYNMAQTKASPGEVQQCTFNWNNDGRWDWVCNKNTGTQWHYSGTIADKSTHTPPAINIFLWGLNKNGSAVEVSNAKTRVFSASIAQGDKIVRDFIPAITIGGAPCMLDQVTNTPFFNVGSGSFVVGFTLNQAKKLKKLPATGGKLTISLPSNYTDDAEVVTALSKAQSNGWTLTVQTYNVADVMTLDLFDIWVRKTQDEQGSYVGSDGVRWQIDWCVEMYTPDGSTPVHHGYESHSSVEEACRIWGLVPYIDPETLIEEGIENE